MAPEFINNKVNEEDIENCESEINKLETKLENFDYTKTDHSELTSLQTSLDQSNLRLEELMEEWAELEEIFNG